MVRRRHILLVEDDPDIRDALAVFFEVEGFAVATADSAESGLAQLRNRAFQAVVSDFNLPGNNGAWMLHTAAEEGRLKQCGALIYTAHHSPETNGFRVLQKPMDLDELLEAVESSMTEADARTPPPEARVELVLYVSARSPASARALENATRIVRRFGAAVSLTIRDLGDPAALAEAENDRVIFTPTLVRRSPAPRAWVLGDLRDRRRVLDVIEPHVAPRQERTDGDLETRDRRSRAR